MQAHVYECKTETVGPMEEGETDCPKQEELNHGMGDCGENSFIRQSFFRSAQGQKHTGNDDEDGQKQSCCHTTSREQ